MILKPLRAGRLHGESERVGDGCGDARHDGTTCGKLRQAMSPSHQNSRSWRPLLSCFGRYVPFAYVDGHTTACTSSVLVAASICAVSEMRVPITSPAAASQALARCCTIAANAATVRPAACAITMSNGVGADASSAKARAS